MYVENYFFLYIICKIFNNITIFNFLTYNCCICFIVDIKTNTIEFRMANRSLNPEIIKQNVFLYSSLIETAIKMTANPELYE